MYTGASTSCPCVRSSDKLNLEYREFIRANPQDNPNDGMLGDIKDTMQTATELVRCIVDGGGLFMPE